METDAIDKLFLELSQFTNAKTGREAQLERELASWIMFANKKNVYRKGMAAEAKRRAKESAKLLRI